MKKHYPLSSRSKEKTWKGPSVVVGFVLFVLIFFSLIGLAPLRVLSGPVQAVAVPIWRVRAYVSRQIGGFFEFLHTKASLVHANQELRSRLAKLEYKLLDRNRLISENRDLKTMLGRLERKEDTIALVLSKPNMSPYDTFILDVGRDGGVKTGNLVSVAGSVIGEITEVYSRSAKAQLFSTPGRKLQVFLGEQAVLADAVGQGGGTFSAKLPHGVSIKEGDFVFLPLQDELQFFGNVGMVKTRPADPFQTILFRSPINYEEVRWVEIVKSEARQHEATKVENEDTEF
jgi:cell shape-determining protein MreC